MILETLTLIATEHAMNSEAWVGLVGIAVMIAGGFAAVLVKLTTVATKVDGLSTQQERGQKTNSEEHKGIWHRLDNHGERITRMEAGRRGKSSV